MRLTRARSLQMYNWLSSRRAIASDERMRCELRGITRDPDAATCLAAAVVDLSAVPDTDIKHSLLPLVLRALEDCVCTLDGEAWRDSRGALSSKTRAFMRKHQRAFQRVGVVGPAARRTESSVDVACVLLRLWCNTYHIALQTLPDALVGQGAAVAAQFARLAVEAPGQHWCADVAGAAAPRGPELASPALGAELLRVFADKGQLGGQRVADTAWQRCEVPLASRGCHVQCSGRVFRPAAHPPDRHGLARAQHAARAFCDYADLRALKREQEALLLLAHANVDVTVDANDLLYDSENDSDGGAPPASDSSEDSSASSSDTDDDKSSGSKRSSDSGNGRGSENENENEDDGGRSSRSTSSSNSGSGGKNDGGRSSRSTSSSNSGSGGENDSGGGTDRACARGCRALLAKCYALKCTRETCKDLRQTIAVIEERLERRREQPGAQPH